MTRNTVDDGGLARLLAEAGSAMSVGEADALIAGVVGAPQGVDGAAWMTLVTPNPGDTLRAALGARLDAARAALGDDAADGPSPAGRLADLRAELARRELTGFVVPRADPHHSEDLPRGAERLAWLTGFSGSAGVAVVLAAKAAIFIDGRYTLQVRSQVDGAAFEYRHLIDEPPTDWVAANLEAGGRLGYDPWLHTPDGLARYRAACKKAGAELVDCDVNPLDAVWHDQPPPPIAPVVAHEPRFAGASAADKRALVAAALADAGAGACVLSTPDSLAWLLNLRGGDVPYSPFPLGFVVADETGRVELFIDRRKLAPELGRHLGNDVSVRDPAELGDALDALAATGKPVLADPSSTSAWVFDRVTAAGGEMLRAADPCALPKARKNQAELDGSRVAHRRDGASLTRFLRWFAETAPGGGLTEIGAAAHLDGLRAENENFRGLSFPTIGGAGPNGAIVHYRASAATNRKIEPGSLFLVDSGGQYLDATTDVTRTIAVGTPSEDQRRHFTAVLKGHIAIATTRFPAGTSGSQLDALARHALWQMGLDYDHGTGHGVGSYLGVHEGPHRISKQPNTVALEPGMIVSNEPGYYKAGDYGIRIENLVCVVEAPDIEGAERPMLGFETLTRAPIDRNLIDAALLTEAETAWLDAYHAEVCEALTPLVDGETAAWLAEITRPLGAGS